MGSTSGRRHVRQQSAISRVDLLQALTDPSAGEQTVARIAAELGLEEHAPTGEQSVFTTPKQECSVEIAVDNPANIQKQKSVQPAAALWTAVKLSLNSPSDQPETTFQHQAVAWQNRPTENPRFHPFCSARSLLARIDHLIRAECPSREVDVEAIVQRVEMAEPLTRIPRIRKKDLENISVSSMTYIPISSPTGQITGWP